MATVKAGLAHYKEGPGSHTLKTSFRFEINPAFFEICGSYFKKSWVRPVLRAGNERGLQPPETARATHSMDRR